MKRMKYYLLSTPATRYQFVAFLLSFWQLYYRIYYTLLFYRFLLSLSQLFYRFLLLLPLNLATLYYFLLLVYTVEINQSLRKYINLL